MKKAGGYDWEPHTVETEDGWYLTIFRITGANGQKFPLAEENKDKPPILIQHGAGDSATGWVTFGVVGPSLPGALAERGYDVWVGNNRGTLYSNTNKNDDKWTLREHWDFNWADMGAYDIPACVDRILEVTRKPKVTLMGYSQGSAQIYYGLAKKQDYFAPRVHRFIGLASCIYANIPTITYESTIKSGIW